MIALENLKELLAGIPVEPHHRHMIEVHIDAAGDIASDASERISELLRFNNEFEGQARAARAALRIALSHIDHMTAWIALQKAGYSFESLGEDMPELRAVLKRPYASAPARHAIGADETARELRSSLIAALEWIDAIPKETVASLPAMPGFDRDEVNALIERTKP